MGSVRVMVNDAPLAAKWWAEAWSFSETVENVLPSARHPGVTPEEKFTGERQDVGYIRVLGCVAYVHIPYEKGGGKLADRGQKGRLMGLEGYRVLIPETGQIIRSRNVVFEEGLGRRTLTDEGKYCVEDDGDIGYDFLGDVTLPIANDEPPETGDTTPPLTDKPKVSRQRITYPPSARKSSRLAAAEKAPQATVPTFTDDLTFPINEPIDEEDESPTALVAGGALVCRSSTPRHAWY
jgi:hypothetical protein